MAQTLKCWVLLGREAGQTEWQLVDDLTTGACRELINDDDVAEMTSFVYWDKEIAKEALEKVRDHAEKHQTNAEYRLGSLWGEVGESIGRE